MPTATKFEAEDVGNGFPFCLPKVDVSDRGDGDPYDYWITLGGFKKGDAGSPTAQQISDSLANAMKLFWNYNGHTVDFAIEGGSTTTITADIEQGDFTSGSMTAPFEPKDRVCEEDGWNFRKGTAFENIEMDLYPIRLYDGSTDDEDNFIGYGIDEGFNPAFSARSFFPFFYFSSLWNELFQVEPTATEYNDALDDIWFVAVAYIGSGTATIDGLTATFEYFDTEDVTENVTYKDFDFWTYPA